MCSVLKDSLSLNFFCYQSVQSNLVLYRMDNGDFEPIETTPLSSPPELPDVMKGQEATHDTSANWTNFSGQKSARNNKRKKVGKTISLFLLFPFLSIFLIFNPYLIPFSWLTVSCELQKIKLPNILLNNKQEFTLGYSRSALHTYPIYFL